MKFNLDNKQVGVFVFYSWQLGNYLNPSDAVFSKPNWGSTLCVFLTATYFQGGLGIDGDCSDVGIDVVGAQREVAPLAPGLIRRRLVL